MNELRQVRKSKQKPIAFDVGFCFYLGATYGFPLNIPLSLTGINLAGKARLNLGTLLALALNTLVLSRIESQVDTLEESAAQQRLIKPTQVPSSNLERVTPEELAPFVSQ